MGHKLSLWEVRCPQITSMGIYFLVLKEQNVGNEFSKIAGVIKNVEKRKLIVRKLK